MSCPSPHAAALAPPMPEASKATLTPKAPTGVLRPGGAAADWLLLAVPGLIWGASFLFIAEGLESIKPNGLTFVRILVGFLALALVPAARRPLAHSDSKGLFWLGLLWFAFPLSMFPFAEQRISSALTGMLNGATPLFTAMVAALLVRRAPSRGIAVGLLVGLSGAVLVAWPSLGESRSSLEGVLLVLAAVTAYGVALNVARPLQQRHGALPVIWRAQAVALVLTAPLGIPDLLAAQWTTRSLLAMLALGALGTGLAQVLVTVAAGRMGPTRASATTFLIPAVALVLGVVVRDERVAWLSIVGGATCVAGAWLIRRAQSTA